MAIWGRGIHDNRDFLIAFSFIRRLLEKFHSTNDQTDGRKVQAHLISIWLGRVSPNEFSLQLYLDKGPIRFKTSVIKFVMLSLYKIVRRNLDFVHNDRIHSLIVMLEDSVKMLALLNSDAASVECEAKCHVLSQVGLLISLANNEIKIDHLGSPLSLKLHSAIYKSIETFRSLSWPGRSASQNEVVMRIYASYFLEQTFLYTLSCHHIKFTDFRLFCKSILDCVGSVSSNMRFDRIIEMVLHRLRILYFYPLIRIMTILISAPIGKNTLSLYEAKWNQRE